ncbi:ABC transporter permease [Streptosporangium sp. NPDC087985]|uniref:ABC transporter permease n=1 Tax=Streptosporangium sp. NPDC087985 TaxID=3366196 RepID=UPI003819B5D2
MNEVEDTSDVWAQFSRSGSERGSVSQKVDAVARPKPWKRFLGRFLRQRLGVVAGIILVSVVTVAVLAPVLAPMDPNIQDLRNILRFPDAKNLLGTDDLGRDVLSRLLFGARVSLMAAVQATLIAVLVGLPFGLIAGYFGGLTDRVISFVNDGVMSMPGLLLAVAIVGMLGPGLRNAMIAIGIVFAPRILRIVRGSVMEVKRETYIEASRSLGTSDSRIIRTHVLPNVRSPLIVELSLLTSRAMLVEASLSFLGMGAQYPEASWGAMVGRAFTYVDRAPYLIVFPGIAIAVVVLAINVVGDALRDSLGRETRRA